MNKPVIALISEETDLNLHLVRQVLQYRNMEYIELNPIVRERNFDVKLLTSDGGHEVHELFLKGDSKVDFNSIAAVWTRGASYFGGRVTRPGTEINLAHYESIYGYEYIWWRLRNRVWVNPLIGSRVACNRLIQCRIAVECGLRVPDQIVSTLEKDVAEFAGSLSPTIAKTISQGGILETGRMPIGTQYFRVADVSESSRARLIAPSLIQEYVKKDYELRVIVIRDQVYAAAIDSSRNEVTALDSRLWQESELTYYRVSLSVEECEALVRVNKRLGLIYSSIDLIRGRDGNLYFLEANPSGQWSYIEVLTGYPITERIADSLLGWKL